MSDRCDKITCAVKAFYIYSFLSFVSFTHECLDSQVAELWQRDRAISKYRQYVLSFRYEARVSINVQYYLQNHKIAFLGHLIGTSGAIQSLYMNVLLQRNFVAEFHQ